MKQVSGEAYRRIRLCVDSYENGEMAGQFCFLALDEPSRTFQSLPQFLIETELLLDEAGFPQSYTAKRSFTNLSETPGFAPTVERTDQGARATFDIRLAFRQHASWQGTVTWVERRAEQSFRSVLELILLLDGALDGHTDDYTGQAPRQTEKAGVPF